MVWCLNLRIIRIVPFRIALTIKFFSIPSWPKLRNSVPQFLATLVLLCFLCVLSSCAKYGETKLGEIDGAAIVTADFEKSAGKELFRQREALYRLEQQKLDEYIGAMLLDAEARRRGISVATLLEQEITSKVLTVTEDEIESFYNANKARLLVDLNKVREQIRVYLRNQRIETKKTAFFGSLRSKAKIKTYLKPPPVFRADVSVVGAPTKGAESARVTIVKFEDFECPFCKQIQPTFTDILTRYGGKVRLVHKDLPLDSIHPLARQGAEAARCADQQGKFWSFHDMLYDRAPKLALEDLKSYAKELGLNQSSFIECLSSGKSKAAVQKDLSEGAQLGIAGTPTLFINGRELSGAQSVEAIAQIIDEELARVN